MLFAPIASKLTSFSNNTAQNLANNPSTTPGYNFWGYEVDNTANSTISYLQLFNLPSSQVTVGTTTPDLIYAINANSSRGFGFGPPLIFEKGISGVVTTTPTGSTAPSSTTYVTIYHEAK